MASSRQNSWVESANNAQTPFPLNNLPCGVFSTQGQPDSCAVAIGDQLLNVAAAEAAGLIKLDKNLLQDADWKPLMQAGKKTWQSLRKQLVQLLREGSDARNDCRPLLHPLEECTLHLPFSVTEYTDFYSGRHHATNVGTMFRGAENALPANWLHIPVGYNGRASSIVVSGTDIRRPHGQLKPKGQDTPVFGPSARFDIELELGAVVGTASQGPIDVATAFDNIFGYVLLNDWSARDIQAWEYQPLGPFQAKATATSISPWIVTADALEAFRVSTPERETPLLDYLSEPGPMLYDIHLAVSLKPQSAAEATRICDTNYSQMYYSSAQQLAHHSSSGCPMRTGDLLGSGTISGPEAHQRGSLLELSWGGETPLELNSGEQRNFLEDYDEVTLHGEARGADYLIGFGDCRGRILPAT